MKHLKTFEKFYDNNDNFGKQSEFDIVYKNGKPVAIKCNTCDNMSYNMLDISKKYCSNCNMFHDDMKQVSDEENPKSDLQKDLEKNFVEWKTDCDDQECFDKIIEIMSERHPSVEPDELAEVCANWISFSIEYENI